MKEHLALALLSLGDLMDQMKRTERAVALYERVPRTSPMRRSADLQQALALDDLARRLDATRWTTSSTG